MSLHRFWMLDSVIIAIILLDELWSSSHHFNSIYKRAASANETRTNILSSLIGLIPKAMGLQYDDSSIWGTIAPMATQLDNFVSLKNKKEKVEQIVLLALVRPVNNKLDLFEKTQAALISSQVSYVKAAPGTLVLEFKISLAAS